MRSLFPSLSVSYPARLVSRIRGARDGYQRTACCEIGRTNGRSFFPGKFMGRRGRTRTVTSTKWKSLQCFQLSARAAFDAVIAGHSSCGIRGFGIKDRRCLILQGPTEQRQWHANGTHARDRHYLAGPRRRKHADASAFVRRVYHRAGGIGAIIRPTINKREAKNAMVPIRRPADRQNVRPPDRKQDCPDGERPDARQDPASAGGRW